MLNFQSCLVAEHHDCSRYADFNSFEITCYTSFFLNQVKYAAIQKNTEDKRYVIQQVPTTITTYESFEEHYLFSDILRPILWRMCQFCQVKSPQRVGSVDTIVYFLLEYVARIIEPPAPGRKENGSVT